MFYLGFDEKYLDSLTLIVTERGARRMGMCGSVVTRAGEGLDSRELCRFGLGYLPLHWARGVLQRSGAGWGRSREKARAAGVSGSQDEILLLDRIQSGSSAGTKIMHLNRWVKAFAIRLAQKRGQTF